ncbi:hypothetical protein EBB07_28720 [Paenibacillaceae bacterium]|nr:hypothetical protein EBB07_28720 [Paenibacillaceae bacterium]
MQLTTALNRLKIFIFLFWNLFKVAVLLESEGVFYKSCGICRGVKHTRINADENLSTGEYAAEFQCLRCGAIGKTTEQWSKV